MNSEQEALEESALQITESLLSDARRTIKMCWKASQLLFLLIAYCEKYAL